MSGLRSEHLSVQWSDHGKARWQGSGDHRRIDRHGAGRRQLFVDEGAHVFIQGRRQEALDEAVKLIGRNVTAVQGDAADLDDLDRLFDTVKKEKGSIDVLWASAGMGEQASSARSPRSSSTPPSR
jgi:NAD(P)-dependent dehydrogenase (short-subunit alcohol dehydrogenase family)